MNMPFSRSGYDSIGLIWKWFLTRENKMDNFFDLWIKGGQNPIMKHNATSWRTWKS